MDAFAADLSSQAEVGRLALQVLEAYPRLDVLINNVGGFWATRHVTADGLERTFAVNHLAAFLLTDLLLDRLKASAPARVVTVSSGAQSLGAIDFGDLQGERDYSGQTAYNQSKLASVMFTYELARRLRGTGVTATALHPGVVSTGFGAEDPSKIFRFLVPLLRPFMKTPEEGAATSIYLASSPKVEGVTGSFFVKGRPGRPTRRRTTTLLPPVSGRSAPTWSAARPCPRADEHQRGDRESRIALDRPGRFRNRYRRSRLRDLITIPGCLRVPDRPKSRPVRAARGRLTEHPIRQSNHRAVRVQARTTLDGGPCLRRRFCSSVRAQLAGNRARVAPFSASLDARPIRFERARAETSRRWSGPCPSPRALSWRVALLDHAAFVLESRPALPWH